MTKRWIEMDADELLKQSRQMRIIHTVCIIFALLFSLWTFWVYWVIDRVTLMGMFLTVMFMFLFLVAVIFRFHIDMLRKLELINYDNKGSE